MATSHPLPYHITFFFNDTPTTEIYTLSLHDALPICSSSRRVRCAPRRRSRADMPRAPPGHAVTRGISARDRSEEHTSELQSHVNLVCRLLLEKKKKYK